MMSHPGYAAYHRLELERNAMVAQYQFEQWNYSRQASRDNEVLQTLGKTDIVGAAAAEAEMEPYKKKAEKELEDYIAATKADLQSRQDGTAELLQKQLASMRNMPDPVGWNDEWKKKLADKEQEMNDAKEVIMADIRARAADVALEQGIDMIFSDYAGIGTALDVTDDIIAKLA